MGPPPTYVKVAAALANFMPLIAAVRNIIMPGTPVSLIPEDDVFQAHFFAGSDDPRMAYM